VDIPRHGFSNLMNMLFFAKQYGIDVDGFVEGDDGIFGMYKPAVANEDYESLGFKIKMNYVTDLGQTQFCGNTFDPRDLKLIISPEQIVRLVWTTASQYFHAKKPRLLSLLRAKAMSLFCLGKDTPIAGALALRVLTIIGPGGQILDPHNKWWDMNLLELSQKEVFEERPILTRSRVLFEERFGVPLDTQFALEKSIRAATTLEELFLPWSFMANSYSAGEFLGGSRNL